MKAKSTLYDEIPLQPGDVFPDFSLPDSTGAAISSTQLLARGPLIVSFYGEGIELNALSLALPEIQELGGALIAISPRVKKGTPTVLARFASNFYVVNDTHSVLARKAGLVYRHPIAPSAGSGNLHLPNICGSEVGGFCLPATYTVDQNSTIQEVFFGIGYCQPVESMGLISEFETLMFLYP